MTSDDVIKYLEVVQRKQSLLIQSFSFWMGVQRNVELRDQIMEQLQGLTKQIMEVDHQFHKGE